MNAKITIIAGPTASGKSALARARAADAGGIVLNADALQLYRELRILSARPAEAEMQGAPHRLFGILTHETQASAGKWLSLAKAEIDAALAADTPVFVAGGTGLYLKALLEGLSPIPPTPSPQPSPPLREREAYALLAARDSVMAARLAPGDTQRIARALAVLEHTGESLAHWQAQPREPLYPREYFHVVRVECPREELYARCDARFDSMLAAGALEEARALREMNVPPEHTLMKAVGVPELLGHLEGKWTLAEAAERAKRATRRYAKRQLTWLRHQLRADEVVEN